MRLVVHNTFRGGSFTQITLMAPIYMVAQNHIYAALLFLLPFYPATRCFCFRICMVTAAIGPYAGVVFVSLPLPLLVKFREPAHSNGVSKLL
jgi:hypothetical protein